MRNRLAKARGTRMIRDAGLAAAKRVTGIVRETTAFVAHVLRRFNADGCYAGAASLSYTTLVSLVPLIAIMLAIFSAFPIFADTRDKLFEGLFEFVVPDIGDEAARWFRSFATSAAQTTAFGTLALVVTAILLLATIEDQMHVIWRVSTRRSWVQRILVYWTILTLGPLFVATSLSLSGYVDRVAMALSIDSATVERAKEAWYHWLSDRLPFVLESIAFALIYGFVPNTRVRWRDAFIGGIVAALLVELLKLGFAIYIGRFSSYHTVYGAIAAVPIFLLWTYLVWSVVLFGAVVASSLPTWHGHGERPALPQGVRLSLALALLQLLDERARGPGGSQTTAALAGVLGIAPEAAEEHLTPLAAAGLVAPTADGGWIQARSLGAATLLDVYHGLGLPLLSLARDDGPAPWETRIAGAVERAAGAEGAALRVPLAQLLEPPPPIPLPPARASRGLP